MTYIRSPLLSGHTLPILIGVLFVLSGSAAQAACDLPVRAPEPDENGLIPDLGYAGPRQAEGTLQYDRVLKEFVVCENGLWVPQKGLTGQNLPRRLRK